MERGTRKLLAIVALIAILVFVVVRFFACGPREEEAPVPAPERTPTALPPGVPTAPPVAETPVPDETPVAEETPAAIATATAVPTETPLPTATFTPTLTPTFTPIPTATPTLPPSPWASIGGLGSGQVFVLTPQGPRIDTAAHALSEGLVVVDLSDGWAPYIFSESDASGGPRKPNAYRDTFIALANDAADPDEILFRSPAGQAAVLNNVPAELRSVKAGERSKAETEALARAERSLRARRLPNHLEVYGIPPTLSVIGKRVAEDSGKPCFSGIDMRDLRALDFEIIYLSHDAARKDFERASAEARGGADVAEDRRRRAQIRLAAVRAVQQRLVCEGLLKPNAFTSGSFDLATHLALAAFEKENDIFGWGFVSGETRDAVMHDAVELHLATFRRVLAERVADAAGIIEDGSVGEATYVDANGATKPVPNLVEDFVEAAVEGLGIRSGAELTRFFGERASGGFASFRIAFKPPPLPPYYSAKMDLAAEIDRGDVWYDPPFDENGNAVAQPRQRYPRFTLFVNWRKQKIPLVHWRTTIGSWRSEKHEDGQIYLKYKNSDVGPQLLRHVIVSPVWIPPSYTPAKDLLTKKVFDPRQGPVTVVNTEVIGPGFASAYGLVMGIHLQVLENGKLYDNMIRTHGSVDYTSIARRYSHGCHRLVNNRAVRLYDFILKHRTAKRLGARSLGDYKQKFEHEGATYRFQLETRGYYYELVPAIPITVTEGRIRGKTQKPIEAYLRKPGVAYTASAAPTPAEAEPVAQQ